jgi:hypothetical protein
VFSRSPDFADILAWVQARGFKYEVHLNRTRFWVPDGALHTEFVLRWYHAVNKVADSEDLATGWSNIRGL